MVVARGGNLGGTRLSTAHAAAGGRRLLELLPLQDMQAVAVRLGIGGLSADVSFAANLQLRLLTNGTRKTTCLGGGDKAGLPASPAIPSARGLPGQSCLSQSIS